MQIQGVLFDFDGTLVDTIPMCVKVYQQVFKQFLGRSFTAEEITANFGVSDEGILQRVLPDSWEVAKERYYEVYEQLHEECREPFADIETALQLLKRRGIRLAMVTGKGAYTAAFSLNYLNLAHYFDLVEVGDPQAIVKARAIRKILTAWNMEPRYAAYVGDSDTDMHEAVTAGVLPLGANWSEMATIHRLTTLTPFATFTTIKDFIRWIDENIEPNNT